MGRYYELGQRGEPPRRHIVWQFMLVFGGIVGVIALIGWYVIRHSGTTIKNAPAVTRVPTDMDTTFKHFDQDIFSFTMRSYWTLAGVEHSSAYKKYNLRDTRPLYNGRILTIYVDGAPPNMALNKSMPIQPQTDRFRIGTISNNCGELLTPPVMSAQQAAGHAPSSVVWQRVHFLCDVANYSRNVVGTGTADETLNQTTMHGVRSGTHRFFFVYTEPTSDPDFTALYDVLKSFRIK